MNRWTTVVAFVGMVSVLVLGASCERTPVVPKAVEPGLPVLFDFETDEAVAAWKVEEELADKVELSVSTDHATTGKRSLKMVLKPHQWPGAHTFTIPKDWSGYSELKFDVMAEQDAELNIRIDDEDSTDYGSRFNTGGLVVNKGKDTVSILIDDVGDAIDLKKVKSLFIFSTDVSEDLTFYLDNIRLAK